MSTATTPSAVIARMTIGVALGVLGYGTIAGSAPSWPDATVYAIAAWTSAVVWLVAAIDPSTGLLELAHAALLALALMRGIGYLADSITDDRPELLSAVATWVVVAVLTARPLRRHT